MLLTNLNKSLLTFTLLFVAKLTLAQGDAIELIKAGREDATKLSQAYLAPLFKGVGFGMNNGWFNSAKSKNLGKFDLRIQATGAFVPTSDRSFDVNTLGLTEFSAAGNSITPTAFGSDTEGVLLRQREAPAPGVAPAEFTMPGGTGFHIVPSPQVQLTVGLLYDSEISVRVTPKVGGGDFGKFSAWGIGFKKEITEILPWKTEKIIPIDLAIAIGYNQVNYEHKTKVEDQIGNNKTTDLNQRIEGKFSGFNADLIVSKKLAIFTPFASLGYNSSKTDFGILGTYDLDDHTDPLVDPVKIKQTDISGIKASVGFGLHLAAFRLYGAYNIGEYQAVTAGIGFGIGK